MTRKKKAPSGSGSGGSKRGASNVDFAAVERLVRLMNENDLYEVEVVSGADQKVRLSRRPPQSSSVPAMHAAPMVGHAPMPLAHPAPAAAAAPAKPSNANEFISPMVGTFYRAPAPEAPPYVNIGDTVGPDTVICLIEAMKVMNEIRAETSGKVVDILVENGEAVEFGQPLFLIQKS